jgi:vanillate monooxygenase
MLFHIVNQCHGKESSNVPSHLLVMPPRGMARSSTRLLAGRFTASRQTNGAVFAEDLAILEGQQENIVRHRDRELLNVKIDAGSVNARRIVERELARG